MAFERVAFSYLGGPHAACETLTQRQNFFPYDSLMKLSNFDSTSSPKNHAHMIKLFWYGPKQIYHQKQEQEVQQILCTFL